MMPKKEKKKRNLFLAEHRSATAPRKGERKATIIAAAELAMPRQRVLYAGSDGSAQYALKNKGKNPAMTVVAKAELAQSYMAQDQMDFLSSIMIPLLFYLMAPESMPVPGKSPMPPPRR